MVEIRKGAERGVSSFAWLHSQHSFSFGSYHDARQQGFSDLLVINDDRVLPGMGFGTHGHQDMEIFTYVLEGALEHKDSMGTGSVIFPGHVQIMSAGTGIQHSEFNHLHTEPLHFLQIWIVPEQKGVSPRYQQAHFPETDKRGRMRLIISPRGADGSLSIYQNAQAYAGLFHGREAATLNLGNDRYAYVHVARGGVTVNGARLEEGDGARIRGESELRFSDGNNAELLAFNLRPNELPEI